MDWAGPVLIEVRNDQVAYAIPRRGTLHQRCCDRIGSRLGANRAGAGEFYCSAKRGAPSRDGEDARTIRRWAHRLLEGPAQDHAGAGGAVAAGRGGNAREREDARPDDYYRTAESR